jgi:hypothetical protein
MTWRSYADCTQNGGVDELRRFGRKWWWYYGGTVPDRRGEPKESYRKRSMDSQCPGRESSKASTTYKSVALLWTTLFPVFVQAIPLRVNTRCIVICLQFVNTWCHCVCFQFVNTWCKVVSLQFMNTLCHFVCIQFVNTWCNVVSLQFTNTRCRCGFLQFTNTWC